MLMQSIISLYTALITAALCAVSGARTGDCKADESPCGPGKLCCTPDQFCNFNRGIPACENSADNFVSGFDGPPCPDPFTYSCADAIGKSLCCPIGTVCYLDDNHKKGACIDAYGVTGTFYPSATSINFTPKETPVSNSGASVVFSPADAWKSTASTENCSKSETIYTTSTINATISFNYTGPSIMVHTFFQKTGGVFNITVDGFPTGSMVKTAIRDDVSVPVCYPNQYPPFYDTPPDYDKRDAHTIIFTYVGSIDAGVPATSGVFDAFAIPFFDSAEFTNSGVKVMMVPQYLHLMLCLLTLFTTRVF